MSRRSAFLLLFGGIWAAIGWGIASVQPSPIQRVGLSPLTLAVDYADLGGLWLAAGFVAVLGALWTRPTVDRAAFVALMLPAILWAASYAVTAVRAPSLTFVLAALVYGALSAAVFIVSGGVEPPRVRKPAP